MSVWPFVIHLFRKAARDLLCTPLTFTGFRAVIVRSPLLEALIQSAVQNFSVVLWAVLLLHLQASGAGETIRLCLYPLSESTQLSRYCGSHFIWICLMITEGCSCFDLPASCPVSWVAFVSFLTLEGHLPWHIGQHSWCKFYLAAALKHHVCCGLWAAMFQPSKLIQDNVFFMSLWLVPSFQLDKQSDWDNLAIPFSFLTFF